MFMEEIFENASDIILFIPRSQTRWLYTIDDGKQHVIIQDDIDKFIKKYVLKTELKKLEDIILRHQPFVVSIDRQEIIELHKQEDTQIIYKQKLKNEINNITKKNTLKTFDINKNSDTWFSDMVSDNFRF